MKIFLVGGAVRDKLLGLEPKDLDYVVVGSTPEEMLNVGYTQVGADFPVFLHPETGEEYALARTETKSGLGYSGFTAEFSPEVTLEDDLYRRDLTVNAMAMDMVTGDIIDPFGGQEDLKNKVLKPVSEHFQEDPVRVLRAAKFLARYPEFVSHISLDMAVRRMHAAGELDSLVPERVWQELVQALSCAKPSRFFGFLYGTGIFPEIEAFSGVIEDNRWHPEYDVMEHIMLGIDYASENDYGPLVTFGVLCHDLGKPKAYSASGGLKSTRHEQMGISIAESFCARLKTPSDYTYMATKACKYHTHVHLSLDMKPGTIYKLFNNLKGSAWVENLLKVAIADKMGRGAPACNWIYTQPDYLRACYAAMESVVSSDISGPMLEDGRSGPVIGFTIKQARIKAIARVDRSVFKDPYDECHSKALKGE